MSRASTHTLLPIDTWGQILGINPAHLNQGATATVMPGSSSCDVVYTQWNWQTRTDRASREDIALAIATAEEDIAKAIGFWPAPRWIYEEVHQYPRYHRPDMVQYGGLDVRGYAKAIRANYGKVIAPGRRDVTLVGTVLTTGVAPGLVYSDADGDGVVDTATVTVATTLTDACEVKVYFAGHAGEMEWEIRPARTKAIAGGNFVATFWAWQLIDPDLWEALPGPTEPESIDWDENHVGGAPPATIYDNLVTSVDVYREFNDTTEVSATFYWEPQTAATNWLESLCSCGGAGTCAACALTTQNGCLHIRDANAGMLVPWPASYDAADGAWESATWPVCRDPDFVKLWYYTGDISQQRLASRTCEPLSTWWAQTITWLSVARLEKPLCSCDNVADLVASLRADVAFTGAETSYNATEAQLSCPWGTRRGALLAWERVSKLLPERRARVALA